MTDEPQSRSAHRFGGAWTEIKLKALTEYLQFYQTALKKQPFDTWYIDAFAGTGDRHAKLQEGGLLEGRPEEVVERILDGSARKALKIDPPFKHYWFSEMNSGRAKQLGKLRSEFPSVDIQVARQEANAGLRALFSTAPWQGSTASARQRAVVFLDPYGLAVEWQTLALLAATKRVDVWYLFPRNAVIQQLANNLGGIDEHKRLKLNQIFGCEDWEGEFYRSLPEQTVMFGEPTPRNIREATPAQIAEFARKRLRTLFCYVSEPLPLVVKGRDYFELYCMSNNGPAVPLICKGVDHVMRKYAPASRHRSVRPEGDR